MNKLTRRVWFRAAGFIESTGDGHDGHGFWPSLPGLAPSELVQFRRPNVPRFTISIAVNGKQGTGRRLKIDGPWRKPARALLRPIYFQRLRCLFDWHLGAKFHAIFGGGPSSHRVIPDPAASPRGLGRSLPLLLVLGGERTVSTADLFTLSLQNTNRENIAGTDEYLGSVRLSLHSAGTRQLNGSQSAFQEQMKAEIA
jgi:hypothetical protein